MTPVHLYTCLLLWYIIPENLLIHDYNSIPLWILMISSVELQKAVINNNIFHLNHHNDFNNGRAKKKKEDWLLTNGSVYLHVPQCPQNQYCTLVLPNKLCGVSSADTGIVSSLAYKRESIDTPWDATTKTAQLLKKFEHTYSGIFTQTSISNPESYRWCV